MPFIAGNNTIQGRKGRVHEVLRVTIRSIAEAKGCHVETVRRAVKAGKVDIHDLRSIADYITIPRKRV